MCRSLLWVVLLQLLPAALAWGADSPRAAAIASAHALATNAGHEIIAAGGNAFDAAVAVAAALAVVEPYGSGLGGGGFWLLHRASDAHQTVVDGRETAPLRAREDMYLDAQGAVIPGLSIDGPLAAAIPGTPAALVHVAESYGRLPLSESLKPAVRLARAGFGVDRHYRRYASWRIEALRNSVAAAAIFLENGDVPPEGYLLRQPDLADTLELLGLEGRAGFYEGALAERMVADVAAVGGLWSRRDLSGYRVVERKPIRGRFGPYTVVSAPPPSSGGVALVTMLNVLSALDLPGLPAVDQKHSVIEAMKLAYRDRAQYLGDPDFVAIDVEKLLHPYYGAGLARAIDLRRATPVAAPELNLSGGDNTTHFSVLDSDGNRAAVTLSLNYPFGSGFVPEGTGVLLNDQMDDFSAKPGAPNAYGLVGGAANAIAPGKRMLSSMSPTFVESEMGVAVIGTPGGSRIITSVLLIILEMNKDNDPDRWVRMPRYHHQYLPDRVQYEQGAFTGEEVAGLQQKGHTLQLLGDEYGNMQAVFWDRKAATLGAASDPRGIGFSDVR